MNTTTMIVTALLQIGFAVFSLRATKRIAAAATRNLWATHPTIQALAHIPTRAFIILNLFAGLFPPLGVTKLLSRSHAAAAFNDSVILLTLGLSMVAWYTIIGVPAAYWFFCSDRLSFTQWREYHQQVAKERKENRARKRAEKANRKPIQMPEEYEGATR